MHMKTRKPLHTVIKCQPAADAPRAYHGVCVEQDMGTGVISVSVFDREADSRDAQVIGQLASDDADYQAAVQWARGLWDRADARLCGR